MRTLLRPGFAANIRRRCVLRVAVRAALLAFLAGTMPAMAQNYPSKPIRIIVPTAPGGGYDFIGRLLADRLPAALGQSVIVENRAGAGTVIGTQAAATAAPDGYTLLIAGLANLAFSSGLYDKLPYNPTGDFVPVALVGSFTYALVARKDLPQSTVGDVIRFAAANPGKLTIATAGNGTGQHIAAALLKREAKIDLLEVPYKGAQPAQTDLIAGRVDLFFDNTTTAKPFIDSGREKPLATSGSQRDPVLPDVPTGREAGLGGLVMDSWIGLFCPAKTPPAVIRQLRSAVASAVDAADTRQRLESSGWRTISLPPQETESFVRAEAARWAQFIREAGIKGE